MIHIVTTKHLAYSPQLQQVYARCSARLEDGDLGMNEIGDIFDGPDFPVSRAVQSEWIDLVEWEKDRQEALAKE